jgi:mono/diheme cytochrome c family protein
MKMKTIMNFRNKIMLPGFLAPALFMICAAMISGPSSWRAPADACNVKNPLMGNKAVLADAKKLYNNTCAPCHGEKGRGDGPAAVALNPKPADHTSATVQAECDGSLFWKISEGKGPMPQFKKSLSVQQRWMLINYIRTLKRK